MEQEWAERTAAMEWNYFLGTTVNVTTGCDPLHTIRSLFSSTPISHHLGSCWCCP
jgi:hypothetical protein